MRILTPAGTTAASASRTPSRRSAPGRTGRAGNPHGGGETTVDAPFVLQSFLAPEALVDAGLEVSYLIPNPWNEYLELILELNSGEGAASESPNLRGDARAQSPSLVSHFLWNKNLTDTLNLELGASTLWGPSENDSPDRAGGRSLQRSVGQRKQRLHPADIARFEPLFEPPHPLFARAVREGVGHDAALRLALQRVIPDGVGSL